MAHAARSLPPLSFDDPSLDDVNVPANDTDSPLLTEAQLTLPSLTFASEMPPPMAAAPKAPAPLAYPVPSYIPEALPDPSFAAVAPRVVAPRLVASARADSLDRVSRPIGPAKLPALQAAPHDPSLEERVIEVIERALAALPPWPAALRFTVPLAVTVAVALVAFVYEIGFTIRTARALVTALFQLGS